MENGIGLIVSVLLCAAEVYVVYRAVKRSKPVKTPRVRYQTVSTYKRRIA